LFITRETVARDTPAAAATSSIVLRAPFCPDRLEFLGNAAPSSVTDPESL
jgi:hypothetical protein